jgi:hypothetical protein
VRQRLASFFDLWPGTVAEQHFWQNYLNDYVSIRLPLECQHLDFFRPGNELKADALNSHLVETE